MSGTAQCGFLSALVLQAYVILLTVFAVQYPRLYLGFRKLSVWDNSFAVLD